MPPGVRALFAATVIASVGVILRAAEAPIRFTNIAAAAGLTVRNVAGTPTKDFIVDSTGNGVAFFDYDNDGDLDVLLVNGSTLEQMKSGGDRMTTLYRNDGAG